MLYETLATEHVKTYGLNQPLVLVENPAILLDGSYLKSILESSLARLSLSGDRLFRYPVLTQAPKKSGGLLLDRALFHTKAEGEKLHRPCIYNAYPTQTAESAYWNVRAIVTILQPSIIIAFGSFPLWTVTGYTSADTYRGSEEWTRIANATFPVIGTYSPTTLQASSDLIFDVKRDIKRVHDNRTDLRDPRGHYVNTTWGPAWAKSPYTFTVANGFKEAMNLIRYLGTKKRLTVDIETQGRSSQITCVGFGYSATEAIVIPLVSKEHPLGHYSPDQEVEVLLALRALMHNRSIEFCNQNMTYDVHVMARLWGIKPHVSHDTYIAQSVLLPGQPRDLAYLASHYCTNYVYWKNVLNDWHSNQAPDSSLFIYNATDAARTFEILEAQLELLKQRGLMPLYDRQIAAVNMTIRMIMRGIRRNTPIVTALTYELDTAIKELEAWLLEAVPLGPSWWNSSKKVAELCYEIFKVPPIMDRKTGNPSTGKEALPKIIKKEPILEPILKRVEAIRQLKNSYDVVNMRADPIDNRYRSTFTVCGAKTFRYTSSATAEGIGTNFQNLSSG